MKLLENAMVMISFAAYVSATLILFAMSYLLVFTDRDVDIRGTLGIVCAWVASLLLSKVCSDRETHRSNNARD